MCDLIPVEMYEPGRRFLEPACGEGIFVLEILRHKFANCVTRADYTLSLQSVYAMDIQADNVEITIRNIEALCREYFRPSKADIEIIHNHVIQADSLKIMRMWTDMEGDADNETD